MSFSKQKSLFSAIDSMREALEDIETKYRQKSRQMKESIERISNKSKDNKDFISSLSKTLPKRLFKSLRTMEKTISDIRSSRDSTKKGVKQSVFGSESDMVAFTDELMSNIRKFDRIVSKEHQKHHGDGSLGVKVGKSLWVGDYIKYDESSDQDTKHKCCAVDLIFDGSSTVKKKRIKLVLAESLYGDGIDLLIASEKNKNWEPIRKVVDIHNEYIMADEESSRNKYREEYIDVICRILNFVLDKKRMRYGVEIKWKLAECK